MDRRGFLASIAAAVTGSVIDPERLLWVPGSRLISIPSVASPDLSQVITAEALKILGRNLKMHSMISRDFDKYFSGMSKIGDTINIKRPSRVEMAMALGVVG